MPVLQRGTLRGSRVGRRGHRDHRGRDRSLRNPRPRARSSVGHHRHQDHHGSNQGDRQPGTNPVPDQPRPARVRHRRPRIAASGDHDPPSGHRPATGGRQASRPGSSRPHRVKVRSIRAAVCSTGRRTALRSGPTGGWTGRSVPLAGVQRMTSPGDKWANTPTTAGGHQQGRRDHRTARRRTRRAAGPNRTTATPPWREVTGQIGSCHP